jgi:hypothetical protein
MAGAPGGPPDVAAPTTPTPTTTTTTTKAEYFDRWGNYLIEMQAESKIDSYSSTWVTINIVVQLRREDVYKITKSVYMWEDEKLDCTWVRMYYKKVVLPGLHLVLNGSDHDMG